MATADFSRIATNIGALNALQSLNNINSKLGVHQQRLATGKRINSAADDPAGLTIATKLNARSEGLKVAGDNIADAKNLLSVAESGLGRISDIMVQMRNKAEQAASDTLGTEERSAIVEQLKAYSAQIDDIVDQTQWNGNNLINGKYNTASLRFQTGADATDKTEFDGLTDVSATGAGVMAGNGLHIAEKTTANSVDSVQGNGVAALLTATTDVATSATDNANIANLGSGTYTIRVSDPGDDGDWTDAKIELLDGSGSAMLISSDGTASGAVALSRTVDLEGAGATIDFGNGLAVDVKDLASLATGTYEIEVGFTADGDYTVYDGTNSLAITKNSTAQEFADYMGHLNTKLGVVSEQLSKVGAMMGRLSFKEEQVSVAQLNVEASYNRIMNADMAYEQLEATKYSILQQTSTTMLAQANTAPQGILGLFR